MLSSLVMNNLSPDSALVLATEGVRGNIQLRLPTTAVDLETHILKQCSVLGTDLHVCAHEMGARRLYLTTLE